MACADGPRLTTDAPTYALGSSGSDVTLTLTSGTTTILGNLCAARLEQLTAGAWQQADLQPAVDASCDTAAMSLGPAGHLSAARHVDAAVPPGTYRFVTNIEDDTTDPPNHPDVPSNSFDLTP